MNRILLLTVALGLAGCHASPPKAATTSVSPFLAPFPSLTFGPPPLPPPAPPPPAIELAAAGRNQRRLGLLLGTPLSHHDDRALLAELLAATRQLAERLGAAARHGFCCQVATVAAREAVLHVTLARAALGDGAREMDGLPPRNAAATCQEMPATSR